MRKSLVEAPLACFINLGFLYWHGITAKIIIKQILTLLLFTYIVIQTFLQYFYAETVAEIVENMETTTLPQLWCKMLVCILHKNKFLNLIQKSRKFWNSDGCSKALKMEIDDLGKKVWWLQKSLLYSCLLGTIILVIPFSLIMKKLPAGIWKLGENELFYDITWYSYAMSIFYYGFFMYSFEGLFIGLTVEGIIQFKILCNHLEQMNVEEIRTNTDLKEYYEKVLSYNEHHKFLRFIKDLQDCYSSVFLIQTLLITPVICSEFYIILEGSSNSLLYRNYLSLILLIVQFGFYCVPADNLTKESSTVANAIYHSNWYGKHVKELKQSTQLMIQETQQEVRMTCLGGLLNINSQTVLNVLRVSFSICTMLRKLKQTNSHE